MRATTLEEATRHPLSRETLAEEIVRALDVHYAALQTEGEPARRTLRDAWRARLVTLGQRVSLRQGTDAVNGFAEDVNEDGGLLLRRDDGAVQTVTWGDVEAFSQQ